MLKLSDDQRGIAAILISMLLVIVSSLIVYGFSEISVSGEREATTSLLSAQANDAAETGINEASGYIEAVLNYDTAHSITPTVPTSSGCAQIGSNPANYTVTYNLSTNVNISCLNISSNTTALTQGTLSAGSYIDWVLNDNVSGAQGINKLVFTWQSNPNDAGENCTSSTYDAPGVFPTYDRYLSTCDMAILRVDLASLPSSGVYTGVYPLPGTNENFIFHTVTLYLQAYGNSSPAAYNNSIPNGTSSTYPDSVYYDTTQPIEESCVDTSNSCSITLNAATSSSQLGNLGKTLYMRISAYYEEATQLQVSAYDANGTLIPFDTQAVVDSTGVAQNVSSRIQAIFNVGCNGSCNAQQELVPNNALESNQSVCKSIAVYGSVTNVSATAVSTNPASCPLQ